MSIKLTDTQLVLLGAAAQRKDLSRVAPSTLKGATAQKVASKLISAGFVEEVKAKAEPSDLATGRGDEGLLIRSSSPPRSAGISRSMTSPSLRMQARKATRSRTVMRPLSRQSWTPRTLEPQKGWSLVLHAHRLHAAARSWPVLLGCLSAIMARPLRN